MHVYWCFAVCMGYTFYRFLFDLCSHHFFPLLFLMPIIVVDVAVVVIIICCSSRSFSWVHFYVSFVAIVRVFFIVLLMFMWLISYFPYIFIANFLFSFSFIQFLIFLSFFCFLLILWKLGSTWFIYDSKICIYDCNIRLTWLHFLFSSLSTQLNCLSSFYISFDTCDSRAL